MRGTALIGVILALGCSGEAGHITDQAPDWLCTDEGVLEVRGPVEHVVATFEADTMLGHWCNPACEITPVGGGRVVFDFEPIAAGDVAHVKTWIALPSDPICPVAVQ